MKTSVYLVVKYWKKHKKNLAAVMFAGVLLTALVFSVLMLRREHYVRTLDRHQYADGAFDIIIGNSDDEILAKATEGKSGWTYGYLNVLGEMGSESARFLYGELHDEHDLYHLPLSEGRLPETSSEIAMDTNTISALFWVGKCGETITLDGNTYTVTGIIDNKTIHRYGWQNGGWAEFLPHLLPPIIIGESDETPLYRVDFLGNYYYTELLPGMDKRYKNIDKRDGYLEVLEEMIEDDEHWVSGTWDDNENFGSFLGWDDNTGFFMFTAYVGIAIAILSVFSVMKSVFTERAAWIATLKRIGAGRGVIARFYAAECAFFTVIQTVFGLIAGLAGYGVIFAYNVKIVGEKPLCGFTSNYVITNNTRDPFLYAILCSIAAFLPAYLLCVLTSRLRAKKPRGVKKPRSLWRCFGRAFAQGSVTVVQTAALALICFAVVMGYLYYTPDSKESLIYLGMPPERKDCYAGGIYMDEEGVAEYYYCTPPELRGIGHQDRDISQFLMTISPDETRGFGDDTAEKLPEGTISTGQMGYLFMAFDKPDAAFGKKIDLSDRNVRNLFFETSSEKYHNFFDEGQLGSKHMYQAPTRLANAETIEALSDYVKSGEINLDAINSGEEVLVACTGRAPFNAGDKVTLYMSAANEEHWGLWDLTTAEVTVGAVLQIPQDSPALLCKAARDSEREWNFLTTNTGALAMGAPSAAYNEAFAFEEVKGAPFPLSAELSVTSLKKLKREIFVNKMKKLGSIILILVTMSLLGFSAYFNGIGMKIRAKKYEVSVLRAVGTPVSTIRRRLMLSSLKIPLIASAISYGLIRVTQVVMGKLSEWFIEQYDISSEMHHKIFDSIYGKDVPTLELNELFKDVDAFRDRLKAVRDFFFLDNLMWQPRAEIPVLIVFAVICAATFVLTVPALKKFKRDIAFDLNTGR